MVTEAWRRFEEEVARWEDAGRAVDFWWRDDDACRDHPMLSRLLELAAASRIPLGLAVVPEGADASRLGALPPAVAVLQHGCDHRNRARAEERKTEFPAGEPQHEALSRLAAARRRLQGIAGERVLPVLVPPWNRIGDSLAESLAAAGYVGLSCFGSRHHVPSGSGPRGLVQVNTHVDIIDWRGGRGFVGEERALDEVTRHLAARRAPGASAAATAAPDDARATGWLTHHLQHDAAAWGFLARLFECTQRLRGVRWRHPADLFRP